MEFLLTEIEKALDAGLYYIALQVSLTLPDICGAMESEDGVSTGAKYRSWFDRYAKESGSVSLSAKDCYHFRCACVHQGSTQHPDSSYSRIFFLAPNSSGLILHNNLINDVLNIDANIFCRNMIAGVRVWLEDVKDDPNFQRNYEKSIKLHPDGLAPFVRGLPTIG